MSATIHIACEMVMTDIAADFVEAMRNPVLVLDPDLSVALANRAFFETFEVSPEETLGRAVNELGNGQWDIEELRRLLSAVLTERTAIEDYRVEHEFERIGRRVMLLNARCLPGEGTEPRVLMAIEDVTERERLRWELEAEKEFAGNVVDASRDALLILDWDLRVKSANETFYTQFGVDPGETEGRLVYELGNGQWEIPHLRKLLEDVLPDNDAFDEFEVEHKFEELGHRIMVLNARRIDHKQWILLAIEDVTERVRSERELRASEARLSAILENVPVGVGLLDKEGRWKLVNPKMRQYVGEYMPSRDPERLGHWTAFDPDGRPLHPSQWPGERALRGEVPVELDFLTDVTGEQRWIQVRAAPLLNDSGEVTEAVTVVLDVSEKQFYAEALRASEKRLRDVLETEAVGVLFFDENGTVTDVNGAFVRMTGYARHEVEAGELNVRSLVSPEWIKKFERRMGRLEETGRFGPYEKEYLCKDGSKSWGLAAGRRLDDGTTVEFCIDIQDRKRAEEESELLLHELSHRVKNTLAVVQALATQTAGSAGTLDKFRDAFLGRLHTLARAHDVLLNAQAQSADLWVIAEQVLQAYKVNHPDLIEVEGAPVVLSAKQALGLSLILHELGTNAAKYGALSRHDGRVRVSWEVEPTEEGRQLRLTWQERHGPPVEQPRGKGFGTQLIERACDYELDGEAELDYASEGLTCRIAFPLTRDA